MIRHVLINNILPSIISKDIISTTPHSQSGRGGSYYANDNDPRTDCGSWYNGSTGDDPEINDLRSAEPLLI